MRQAQIFISYRRDDAAGYARAIHDALAREFSAGTVFIDVDDIGAGQAFADVIRRAVGQSQVLLVLIGRHWLGERPGMSPRLFDEGDFVRLEIEAALAQDMCIIPLLLDGAPMPTEAQLPAPLRPLAGRNGLEVGNTRFAADLERLIAALRETVSAPPPSAAAASASNAARPDVNGEWQAEVDYDWPGAHHTERFNFAGAGAELRGSASFLGLRRGLLEGRITPDGLSFVTRTSETTTGASGGTTEIVHRYQAERAGDALKFMMQTEGGVTPHVPVEFVARRVAAGTAPKD